MSTVEEKKFFSTKEKNQVLEKMKKEYKFGQRGVIIKMEVLGNVKKTKIFFKQGENLDTQLRVALNRVGRYIKTTLVEKKLVPDGKYPGNITWEFF